MQNSSFERIKAFAFGGENRQIELLVNEGVKFVDGKVDMKNHQWSLMGR